MKRILSLPIIFSLVLSPVLAQNKIPTIAASDPNEIVGRYIYSSGFEGAIYEIRDEGKYEYTTFSDCCDPVWRESGSYSLGDNLLHFKITTKTLNNYDLLDPKKAIEAYQKVYDRKGTDVPARVTRTDYDMQIVRWGGRIYLVDPDKINLFTAAVNFEIEPRKGIISRHSLTTLFLRSGDENKAVTGKPMLPEPWLSHLQDSPIRATVTKVVFPNKQEIYTVNKGSSDGLKVGMLLRREIPRTDYGGYLVVISVEEGSATLKGFYSV